MDESRREFLKTGAMAAGAMAAARPLRAFGAQTGVVGANDRVRVGIVGLHGRGRAHIRRFGAIPNVEIAALCDVDDSVMRPRLATVRKMGFHPKTYVDVRKLLDDPSIDAISVATSDHWHALMTIWACQAGKDVLVEKPCSHNIWEGKQMVRAANKYNRIVQDGTQERATPDIAEAVKKVQSGLLGDVYMARGLCYKWRNTIGHTPPSPVPPGVDYNLWLGPAPEHAFTKNRFLYNWHWFWDYGSGDIGNQGEHQMDVARWGLGLGYPNKISAIGGHFMFDDDQQTPNTLNTAFQYDHPNGKRTMLEFEVRHWITNHEAGIGAGHDPESNTIGNIFYGSKGYMAIDNARGYRTWMGRSRQPGPSAPRTKDKLFENFIACVVSRKKEDQLAPIEQGAITSGLTQLANASYRLGRTLDFDPETQTVKNDEEASRMLRGEDRGYRAPFTIPEHV